MSRRGARKSRDSMLCATLQCLHPRARSLRPQRLEQLMASFPWQEAKSELNTILKRVVESTPSQERKRYQVLFSDLDANNHVNAARYLQWIMDSYPREVQEGRQLESAEISYLAEATTDEEITVHFEQRNAQELNTIKRVRDLKDICRAVIHWR